MTSLAFPLFVIADARIEAVHEAFNNRRTDMWPLLVMLLVVGVALAGLFGGIYLHRKFLGKPLLNRHKLFAQLCRAHQLTGTQSRLLRNLADRLKLPTPSVLMLDVGLWQLDDLLQNKIIDARRFELLQTLQRTLYTEVIPVPATQPAVS